MSGPYSNEPASLEDFYNTGFPSPQETPNAPQAGEAVPEGEESFRTYEDILKESTQQPAPQVTNNVVQMVDPNAETERLLRLRHLEAIQAQEAREAREAREKQLAEYRERATLEADARARAYFPEEAIPELPENLREDYQALAPILKHAVATEILNERKKNQAFVRDQELRLRALQAELESTRAAQTQVMGSQIDREIMHLVPDANVIASTPSFQQFRDSIDPKTGLSRRTLLQAAYNENNPKAVANILEEFKQSSGAFGSGASPRPTLNSGPKTKQSTKPLYRASDYDEAARKFAAGLMDEETWNKIDSEYTAAVFEGRVVA